MLRKLQEQRDNGMWIGGLLLVGLAAFMGLVFTAQLKATKFQKNDHE